MWTAAILAGGQARRLGGVDKGRLVVGGVAIIERQLTVLRPLTDQILIVTRDVERYLTFGVPVVADRVTGAGPLGAIYTALETAAPARVLALACDLPFVTTAWLEHVMDAGRVADVAIPRTEDGYHPLCASYSQRCLEPIRRQLEAGRFKVTNILADVVVCELGPSEVREYDPDGRLLLNVNTPDQYHLATNPGPGDQGPTSSRS
jgi:molybdenum cofactor guanylyltransferase